MRDRPRIRPISPQRREIRRTEPRPKNNDNYHPRSYPKSQIQSCLIKHLFVSTFDGFLIELTQFNWIKLGLLLQSIVDGFILEEIVLNSINQIPRQIPYQIRLCHEALLCHQHDVVEENQRNLRVVDFVFQVEQIRPNVDRHRDESLAESLVF